MKILFWVPYPVGEAPSQRFRFEQYFEALSDQGYSFQIQSFWDESTWHILYRHGHRMTKTFGMLRGFLRRLMVLGTLQRYDVVFIHREAAPVGPPVFEWLAAKLFNKRIVYDFDDAIWLPNTSAVNALASRIKWHSKVGSICRWAYKVSCGNDYLCTYARQFNPNVVLNPTTIDTEGLHNQVKTQAVNRKPVIGWTGTHSTLSYLDELIPLLSQLEEQFEFELCIIANQTPEWSLTSLRFIPWNKDTEIEDLLQLDIGLMPLTDDVWSRGKCGFKALQYMALGIPPLVSPVGVNELIVDDGVSGFVCRSVQEWKSRLIRLLKEFDVRKQMGRQARMTVENKYSVRSNKENFLRLFTE